MDDVETQIRLLRHQEWLRERHVAALLVLGGPLRFDGWGRPAGFRVLGYSKSFDKAIELGMKKIAENTPDLDLRNAAFHAELTLQLWTPAGPKK